MRIARALRVAAPLVLATAAFASAQSSDRRTISETDLFQFVWLGEVRVSPNGRQVAFVRVTADEKEDGYATALWLVPSDGSAEPRPLTNGTRDSAPRWSPDGRQVAFVRVVEKDGRAQPSQIYVLDMTGGEARPVTDVLRGAASPAWSPDGRTIAFTSRTGPKDREPQKPGEVERQSDVRVITRPSIVPTAGDTRIRTGIPTSGPSPCPGMKQSRWRRGSSPTASSTNRVSSGRPMARRSTSRRIAWKSRTTFRRTATSTRCPPRAATSSGSPASTGRLASCPLHQTASAWRSSAPCTASPCGPTTSPTSL